MPALDPATLLMVSCATTFLVGVQFMITWRQMPSRRCLKLWGTAHLVGSFGSIMLALRDIIPDWISIGCGNVAMIAAYGLIWSGVRTFERRPPHVLPAILGSGVWAALCLIPAFYESIAMRVGFASLVAGLYCTAGAWEFWQGRAEPLPSRRYAIGLLATYAVCYFVRIPASFLAPLQPGQPPLTSKWVAVLCLAAMLFSIASAFTFINLNKERAEREQRLVARTDPLLGIANRRAFLESAEEILARRSEAALLLLDLDRFKAVNDRFGHGVGDAVLLAFCAVAEGVLPPSSALGRLGGEEFGCFLANAAPEDALRVAERIRRTFARVTIPELPGLHLSVSIGIAHTSTESSIDRLLRQADAALYAAKERGRDRVEVAEPVLRAA